MKDIDNKIIYLMNKLYKLSHEENEEFKKLIGEFDEQEKIDIAYKLRTKVREEESVISKVLKKIKLIKNDIQCYKIQNQADELLKKI